MSIRLVTRTVNLTLDCAPPHIASQIVEQINDLLNIRSDIQRFVSNTLNDSIGEAKVTISIAIETAAPVGKTTATVVGVAGAEDNGAGFEKPDRPNRAITT